MSPVVVLIDLSKHEIIERLTRIIKDDEQEINRLNSLVKYQKIQIQHLEEDKKITERKIAHGCIGMPCECDGE